VCTEGFPIDHKLRKPGRHLGRGIRGRVARCRCNPAAAAAGATAAIVVV
jgi:hypothetical protein